MAWLDCFEVYKYERGSLKTSIDSVNRELQLNPNSNVYIIHNSHGTRLPPETPPGILDDTDEFDPQSDQPAPNIRFAFDSGMMTEMYPWPDVYDGPWEIPNNIWDLRFKEDVNWDRIFEQIMEASCPLLNVFDIAKFLKD